MPNIVAIYIQGAAPIMHSSQSFNSYAFRHRRLRWLYLALLIAGMASLGSVWPTRATGSAALVKDINPNSTRHAPFSLPSPDFMTSAGTRVYFLGYDINNGYELWSSDGTPSGTSIVRDIAPGYQDTIAIDMVNVAGTLFFSADTDGLWKTDGTAAGTIRMKLDGRPAFLTNVNGTLFFLAQNQNGHRSLWKSDGSETGTVEVKDISPTGDDYPTNLTSVGDKLFFIASDGVNGRELWQSDGTTDGTLMVKNISPFGDSFGGPQSPTSPELTDVGGKLFFVTTASGLNSQLWKSDGTVGGTSRVFTTDPALQFGISELENVNGKLFFAASRSVAPAEGLPPTNSFITSLWQSDGTAAGTAPVKDLGTGNSRLVSNLHAMDSRIFFAGPDYKLWSSDGTDAGTTQIGDVIVGGDRVMRTFTNVVNHVFFVGQDSGGDIELWHSDGTSGGTARVKDINAAGSSAPAYLAKLGNTLLFSANDGQGTALWRTDGSDAGTTLVKDTARTASGIDDLSSYYPPLSSGIVGIGDKLFFVPDDGVVHGQDLWVSDGTADGTTLVKHIDAGAVSRYSLTEHNDRLFFIGKTATATNLWQSDGTTAGTIIVQSFAGDTLWFDGHNLISAGNALFFFMGDVSGYTLWRSDGSAAGTTKVTTLPQDNTPPSALMDVNGRLFFLASDSIHGLETWTSDGTVAGTHLLKDISPSRDSSEPFGLTNVNGTLFFMVRLGTDSGYELWKSDGSLAGTVRVTSLGYSFSDGLPPADLTVVGTQLFFSAFDTDGGDELWVSDGSALGTRRVKDINTTVNFGPPYSNNRGSSPLSLANVNGILLFSADDGVHGRELWRSDGTEAGTMLVKDLNPGTIGSGAGEIRPTTTSAWVLFAASDGFNGVELWKTNGSATGTVQIQDISPGASSSNPTAITIAGSRYFFVADDGSTGPELWSLDSTILNEGLISKLRLPLIGR
jgi:ELWxxDGT repeat protein